MSMNKPYGYVYMITNRLNGKVYIGGSHRAYNRWSVHKNSSKTIHRYASPLHVDMHTIGTEFFEFKRIVAAKNELHLRTLEKIWIYIFDVTNPVRGYNKLSSCIVVTPETKQKIRDGIISYRNRINRKRARKS